MTLNSFLSRHRRLVFASTAIALVGGAALAQTAPVMERVQWDNRKLDQLDRNVRRLERALTQRNAAGQPVLVEPDPEVVALEGRVGVMDRRLSDIEQTVQRINADSERLTFQLDEANRDNGALRTRLTDAEHRIEALETTAKEAADEAALNGPVTANSPTGNVGDDLKAAVALTDRDPARGARALETVIVSWPDSAEAREAGYRLGDLRAANRDQAGAVQAYAGALQGWPRAPWAGDVTLKLAAALNATDRDSQACAALGEFSRRYAASASAALKTRATQLQSRAECD